MLKFASVIIDHYTFQLLADIALWVIHLTTKRFLGLAICVTFGLVGALGMGLAMVTVISLLIHNPVNTVSVSQFLEEMINKVE